MINEPHINNATPIVSVVIPTYNHAHFLTKALSSLKEQTITNWEAIIVNNYSTDNTEEVVQSFSDERFRLINFKNNGVIAASRNQGIQHSRGEYVAFLDSDDYWYPNKLARSLKFLQEGTCDLICNSEDFVENDQKIATWHHGPNNRGTYTQLLMKGNCVSTSATIVRKSFLTQLNGFREDTRFITAEDYDLWLRLAKAGCRFKFIHEILGAHLKHANNNSGAVVKHFNAVSQVLEDHLDKLPTSSKSSVIKRACQAVINYGAARQFASQGQLSNSARFFSKSIRLNPFRMKTYAGFFLLLMKALASAPRSLYGKN